LKSNLHYVLLFVLFAVNTSVFGQQKIGLVLSGGGASGLAHIGVLKALEENDIPIDFITGTSAGSLVGSLYACGLSPEEIEAYVLSEDFQLMSSGKLKSTQHFLYKENEANAATIEFPFSTDSLLTKSLPTNFIGSAFLDFEMMKILGTTSAARGNNFDSLFVPFRCVASDVANKESVVFHQGYLNQSVRASMTYPFYLEPIRVNGVLLFDGGLYNNFPADIMYQSFSPDYIIGSNVSGNAPPPSEDDLISQLTNMLVSYSNFSLPCKDGILIEPKTTAGTFEFSAAKKAIDDGYTSTMAKMDSIKFHVKSSISREERNKIRATFRKQIPELGIGSISNLNSSKKEISYTRRSMIVSKKGEVLSSSLLEKRYYRLYATPQIGFIYPLVQLKPDSTYHLGLEVRKAKNLNVEVGGHFSSRAVNTGFIGLTLHRIGKTASSLYASSYFGKFYGSIKTSYQLEIPSVFPVSVKTYFVLNRWDYFRSFATFFEEVKPSFLVQNELYYGLQFNHPIGNTTKSTFDFRMVNLEDDYYQTTNFTDKDTSDITQFDGASLSWEFVQNSLNRKQFASSGLFFKFKFRYVTGNEKSIPGSTSVQDTIQTNDHEWINLNADFQSFILDNRFFHLGIQAKGVLNSQSLFTNYTATLLSMTTFSPIPDAETFFLPEYRSPQFVGIGTNLILTPRKNLDLRLDAFYFQPFVILEKKTEDGTPSYSKPFKGQTLMASASIIYHSFIGPIRLTANYFPKQSNPFSFQFSYGYVLFNERAIR
jgi:NTE family protein